MDFKKLLIGTLAGTVAGMALGFLVFGTALKSFMANNFDTKEPPDFLWLILGHAAFAALLSYIFTQWAGIKTFTGGAKGGAIIALLATLAFNWIYLGTSNLVTGGPSAAVIDALASSVVWAIAGGAIGWALGKSE